MAAGLRPALVRPLMAIQPSISRLAPSRARYWLAFMPIQLDADIAPKGIRHCLQPDAPPPPPPRSPRLAEGDSQTTPHNRHWRDRPEAPSPPQPTHPPP